MRGVLVGLASLGIGFAVATPLLAQQSQCRWDSHCGTAPCQVLPGGIVMECQCCPTGGGGNWFCCDNVPCQECIIS